MSKKTAKDPADYILPLYMNGLQGRMLRLPPPKRKKREYLVIPGQHTSIERMMGLAEYLNRSGGVTLPDLPGFGGMEPFYKIGEKPTLDTLADYLASFVKLRYRNRRFGIIAVSFGFEIITRMLQRYPEIAAKTDLIISISGFVHKDDFRWKRGNLFMAGAIARIGSHRLPSVLARHLLANAPLIRAFYRASEKKHPKLRLDEAKRDEIINFEVQLWKMNDLRTWMETISGMLSNDLTNIHVNLPVYHIAVEDDHYFNNVLVEQHMRAIYSDFILVKAKMPTHAPTILATAEDVAAFVPRKIQQVLKKKTLN